MLTINCLQSIVFQQLVDCLKVNFRSPSHAFYFLPFINLKGRTKAGQAWKTWCWRQEHFLLRPLLRQYPVRRCIVPLSSDWVHPELTRPPRFKSLPLKLLTKKITVVVWSNNYGTGLCALGQISLCWRYLLPTPSGRVKRSWQEFSLMHRTSVWAKCSEEGGARKNCVCGDVLRCVFKDITDYSCLSALYLKYIK